jgi:hypothetical protein
VTAGTFTTARGGSVVIASNGNFVYDPPVGYAGGASATPDSFAFTVNASEGSQVTRTAEVTFADTCVWYVNNALSSPGDGRSASPFNSLAGASAAAGECNGQQAASTPSTVFLYAGSGSYTGGIVLGANETLTGQSGGLVVASQYLVAASGSNPVITNASGAGVVVAQGDEVSYVNVASTSGDGIDATNVNALTIDGSVSISGAGGNGISINGGSGSVAVGASITGSTAHSVYVENRTGGTVTVSGTINDSGQGIETLDNTGATITFSGALTLTTAANTAFDAIGGGTVNVTGESNNVTTTTGTAVAVVNTSIGTGGLNFVSINAGTSSSGPAEAVVLNASGTNGYLSVSGIGTTAGSGGTIEKTTGSNGAIYAVNTGQLYLNYMSFVNDGGDAAINGFDITALSFVHSTVTNESGAGVNLEDDGSVSGTISDYIEYDSFTGGSGSAISIDTEGTSDAFLWNDQIGSSGTSNSGSTAADGIDLESFGGVLLAELLDDSVYQIEHGRGIDADSEDDGVLDLTFTGNTVATDSSSAGDGLELDSDRLGDAPSALCFNEEGAGNTVSTSGTNEAGIFLNQEGQSGEFALQGYTGGSTNGTQLFNYVVGAGNSYSGGTNGGNLAYTLVSGNTTGYTGQTCTQP